MSREQTKAAHYIQQLDEARCEGNWERVPELVRKIRKHAPLRACLALAAEAEHAVTQASQKGPATGRPETARPATAASIHTSPVAKYIPRLLDAIENERTYMEDEFQAQVCLGWVHWYLDEPALAAGRLPKSVEQEFAQLDGTNKDSVGWTKICALKASYIKGSAQVKTGASSEALVTFESALPIFASISAMPKQGKEQKIWTELYLTGFCMLSSQTFISKDTPVVETETLSAFRAWARFWETQAAAPIGGRAPGADVSRLDVWKQYYMVVSIILQQELPFPITTLTTAYPSSSTRLQQRTELKRVEAKYETLLLKDVQFPKAEETNEQMEDFVELVMQNWRVLCGSTWKEEDLGEGGAEGVSRGVLDILYRAASKTFHSTPVLRHLFTVHLAVAEFDIAFKAFDTYMEIVKKGKARVEKAGEPEQGLDGDEDVLRTVSECIKALCKYGSRTGAEKAKDLAVTFEIWLDKHHPIEQPNGDRAAPESGNSAPSRDTIAPKVLALAWRCIGIGHAQWARFTYDAASRTEIQLQAIKCFRKSLYPAYESNTDVETLFALGTILAERRELATAIEVVKTGLLPHKPSTSRSGSLGPHPGRFARERSLIPLWHLMALLLSARQEFQTAARACEGAFEQFQDPKYLFGDTDLNSPYRSDHLKMNEKSSPHALGVVDDMDDFEKENVLQVKMTQLALIEVLEGSDIAVNASDELLSLYRRLFGDPSKDTIAPVPPTTASLSPPKSSSGTIRSIKGSIFGRSGRSTRKSGGAPVIGQRSAVAMRPQTSQTLTSGVAPVIQVTSENGSTAKQHHHLTKEHPPEKQKRSSSLSARRPSGSVRKRSSSASRRDEDHTATTVDGEKFFTPLGDTQHGDQWLSDGPQAGAGSPHEKMASSDTKPSRPLPPKSQQMQQKEESLKPTSSDSSKNQDNRLPRVSPYSSSTAPVTRFPKDQQRRHRTSILIKVWLLVAGFYRRAEMHEDSKVATEEASKLAQHIELDVLNDTSGNVSISNSGWGSGKSVGELLSDVFSERGYLALAESNPYLALAHFETSLTHFGDHPSAIVGLSNILLDIYNQDLSPPPSITSPILPGSLSTPSASTVNTSVSTTPLTSQPVPNLLSSNLSKVSHGPLGISLPGSMREPQQLPTDATPSTLSSLSPNTSNKESSTALLDRLAARDRAYGLLSMLTKLGTGWNYSEAWFALARAYELGGQVDKAKEVLWWCVELEEGRAIRDWREVVGSSGYVL